MPTDTKARDEHSVHADEILAAYGAPLQQWLTANRLDISQAKPYHWGPLTSKLRSEGKLPQAEAWIAETQRVFSEMGITNRKRTAGEIARRFLAAKMEQVEATARPMKNQVKYLSHLPVHYVWAGNHPDFVPLPDDATPDQRVKRDDDVKRYERKHPAPNQLAINMLLSCQQDKSARQNLFKETNNFTRDERKKVKTVKTEQEKEEDRACDDIEAEIEKLSKKVRVN